jgi:hypothetical protein
MVARMIERSAQVRRVTELLREHPVVAILGARQVGKTTLAAQVAAARRGAVHRFDLEDPRDVARLADPMLALADLRGLVVLDEVQHRPELFPSLRVLADRTRKPARFLVLGSASPDLLRQSSETLAGRIHYHRLGGLRLKEVGAAQASKLWLRGGFPRSLLAKTDAASMAWRHAFSETFLQRDIPRLGIHIGADTLRSFWHMLAHYHGQIFNASELARSMGVSVPTIGRYVDLLVATFMARRLRPWHENIKKRQVRSPKIYLDDTGMLHALMNLPHRLDLERHPKVGASWEGFAISEVLDRLGARPDECWFWATHQGAELDLLVVRGSRRHGFELKRSSAPRMTAAMRIALADLRLADLTVVHAGTESYPLAKNVRAIPITRLDPELRRLR